MILKRYLILFLLLTYTLNATTTRDIMTMRTAVFGSIFSLIYYAINLEKDENLSKYSDYSLLFFTAKEFAPDAFLYGNRLSLSKENSYIVENSYYKLTTTTEFSIMRWDSHKKSFANNENLSGYIYSITPIFRYSLKGLESSKLHPFFELGVGASLMDNVIVESRYKSTLFQFNDNIGAGLTYSRYTLGYRFIHYSNLNIKTPNPSIDLHNLYFGFRF